MAASKQPLSLLVLVSFLATFIAVGGTDIDPEMVSLLKKAKSDIMKLDPKKVTPSCRRALSKCRNKALTVLQAVKYIQENPVLFLESKCFVERLREGLIRTDLKCDMAGKYGRDLQCLRDPILRKAIGTKLNLILPFLTCMVENAENYDKRNPDHIFKE